MWEVFFFVCLFCFCFLFFVFCFVFVFVFFFFFCFVLFCFDLFFNLQSAVSEFLDFRQLFWEKSIVLLCSPEMFVFISEVGQIEC